MWNIFGRKGGTRQQDPPAEDKRDSAISRAQRKCADRLQQWSERLSRRKKIAALILFLLVFGGASVAIIWQALSGGRVLQLKGWTLNPPPLGIDPRENPPESEAPRVSRREYDMVRAFHRYLDSLGGSEAGRSFRDSLLRERPGLMDSLDEIERAYK